VPDRRVARWRDFGIVLISRDCAAVQPRRARRHRSGSHANRCLRVLRVAFVLHWAQCPLG
jgi:hypothetical protein